MLYWNFWATFWKGWAEAAGVATNSKEEQRPQALSLENMQKSETSSLKTLGLDPEFPEARAAFLANMNHDLRTPLNAVIGFAQIIESEIFGQISPQYLEYARHIQESGYDLLAKIEDLLTMAEEEHLAQEADYEETKRLAVAD